MRPVSVADAGPLFAVAQLELKIMALDRLPTLNGLQFMRAANNRGRDRPVKTGGWVVQQPGWCNNRHGRVKVACRILNSLSIVAVSDSAGRLHNLSSRAAHQIKVQFKFN